MVLFIYLFIFIIACSRHRSNVCLFLNVCVGQKNERNIFHNRVNLLINSKHTSNTGFMDGTADFRANKTP